MAGINSINEEKKLTRRQRKALRTSQRILESASTLFSKNGYEQVKMEDISEEVDISRATLYNYYGSKEAIYFEIGKKGLSEINKKQRKILQKEGTGRELTLLLVEDTLEHLFEDPLKQEIIRQYSISNAQSEVPAHITLRKMESGKEIDDTLQIVLASFLKEMRAFEENWGYAINLGYRDGSINHELDTEQLTHFMFMVILGIVDRTNLENVLLQNIGLTNEKLISSTINLLNKFLQV